MKQLTLLLGLIITISGFSQSEKEIADLGGFDYHVIIKNISKKEQDSIKFIITKSANNDPKPTIIFLQGSGNYPLLLTHTESDSTISYSWLPPFDIKKYKNNYRFVFISKPGIPLSRIYTEERPSFYDTALPGFSTFLKNDYLDYYVNTTNEVLKYLKKQKIASEIFAIGHSAGAHVVAQLCAQERPELTKGVYLSSDIISRKYEEILNIRNKAESGEMPEETAEQYIKGIYQQFDGYKKAYDYYMYEEKDTANADFYQYRNNYSYNYNPAYKALLKAKIPIFVGYGTADPKSRDLDLLHFLCEQEEQKNIYIKTYPGLDHNFMIIKTNEDGTPTMEFFFDNVFEDIEKWLKAE